MKRVCEEESEEEVMMACRQRQGYEVCARVRGFVGGEKGRGRVGAGMRYFEVYGDRSWVIQRDEVKREGAEEADDSKKMGKERCRRWEHSERNR